MLRQYIVSCAFLGLISTLLWGFFAHQKINRHAVFSLPVEMLRFYKNNISYISDHAVDADKRRYVDTAEAAKHYIDVDAYEPDPFQRLPHKWAAAETLYTAKVLQNNGIIPWQIQRTYYSLVRAFRARDSSLILRHSADIGHYISDAHVPLHTTRNYNGQLTGQYGIHGFWESRLPELFSHHYQYVVGKAKLINDPLAAAWTTIRQSYSLKDSVLQLEKSLSNDFNPDKKYAFGERNGTVQRHYSEEYSRAYHTKLKGMVEERMRSSIHLTASFWYTAWSEAGQPSLSNFPMRPKDSSDISFADRLEKLFRKGKIIGRAEN